MSSEALLENPALFCANVDPDSGAYLDQPELARRYLRVCRQLPPPTLGHVRSHPPTRPHECLVWRETAPPTTRLRIQTTARLSTPRC